MTGSIPGRTLGVLGWRPPSLRRAGAPCFRWAPAAKPRFAPDAWESAVLLWANTTLGLMGFWWLGSRQQQGRSILTISRLPGLLTLDPRELGASRIAYAKRIAADFREAEFLPANEAYHDDNRKALDRAVIVDLLRLPEELLGALDLLRRQWCAEPTVHGGKQTRPSPP